LIRSPMLNALTRRAFRGNSRVIAIVVVVLLLLIGGGGVYYFLSSANSSGSNTAGGSGANTGTKSGTTDPAAPTQKAAPWLDAPATAIAAGGINSPQKLMEQIRALIQQACANNPQIDEGWRKAQGEMIAYFGVDPTDPAKLPSLGIDPGQPMHFSLLE